MAGRLELPLVDLSSPDRASAAKLIRQACLEYGFFYLINHGIEEEIFQQVFRESKRFFSLPLDEKMKLERNKDHRGYTPIYAETLDPSSKFKGDLKESFYIGPAEGSNSVLNINQWPSEESLPFWRATMESYYQKVLTVGKRLASLIALALNLDDQFFEKIGALHVPMAFVRLLQYPGELIASDNGKYGASAHSDYGMVTLLATDGVPGLQICREKDRKPRLWEDVHHVDGGYSYCNFIRCVTRVMISLLQWIDALLLANSRKPVRHTARVGMGGGAFIVNVGDMLERWTNCLFRSTLHRVLAIGQERYSVAFFLDPNPDCLVECLGSCCSEISPPRFPPIRSGDYLQERLRITYSSK